MAIRTAKVDGWIVRIGCEKLFMHYLPDAGILSALANARHITTEFTNTGEIHSVNDKDAPGVTIESVRNVVVSYEAHDEVDPDGPTAAQFIG